MALARHKQFAITYVDLCANPNNQGSRQFDNEYRLNLDDAVIVTSVPMHGHHPDA
jgi:hypothetical protein